MCRFFAARSIYCSRARSLARSSISLKPIRKTHTNNNKENPNIMLFLEFNGCIVALCTRQMLPNYTDGSVLGWVFSLRANVCVFFFKSPFVRRGAMVKFAFLRVCLNFRLVSNDDLHLHWLFMSAREYQNIHQKKWVANFKFPLKLALNCYRCCVRLRHLLSRNSTAKNEIIKKGFVFGAENEFFEDAIWC